MNLLILQNQLELMRALSYVHDVPPSVQKRLEERVDATKKALTADYGRLEEIRTRHVVDGTGPGPAFDNRMMQAWDDIEYLLGLVTK